MSGGPAPARSKAITVPSCEEVVVAMSPPFRVFLAAYGPEPL
jgi:hypothetical protein